MFKYIFLSLIFAFSLLIASVQQNAAFFTEESPAIYETSVRIDADMYKVVYNDEEIISVIDEGTGEQIPISEGLITIGQVTYQIILSANGTVKLTPMENNNFTNTKNEVDIENSLIE